MTSPQPTGPGPLPPALRERVLRSVSARPSPTRPAARRWRAAACALSFSLAVVAVCVPQPDADLRPPAAIAAGVFWGLLVVAAAARVLFVRPGALWPPRGALRATALGAPAALALYPLLGAALWPLPGPPEGGAQGVLCVVASTVLGAFALGGLLFAHQKSDPVSPGLSGAALGALAGAWAALSQYIRCPFGAPLHALTTHVLPALLLAGLGWLLGRYALDPLARRGG
ncbi:MAG TPA: NrsF family protein [Polyangiaceae bacterium]|nr:NrsF family protein [Polyangiaceae bacterium]